MEVCLLYYKFAARVIALIASCYLTMLLSLHGVGLYHSPHISYVILYLSLYFLDSLQQVVFVCHSLKTMIYDNHGCQIYIYIVYKCCKPMFAQEIFSVSLYLNIYDENSRSVEELPGTSGLGE